MNKTHSIKKCEQCNKSIIAYGNAKRRLAKRFCSRICRGINERKLPIRNCLKCGEIFNTTSSQIKRGFGVYCSFKCYGLSKRNPDYKPNENHKIRTSWEYIKWRTNVYKRDNHTCQQCGTKGGCGKRVVLNADHIKKFSDYPELRFELSNGRTLCIDCHRKTETYGRRSIKI